MSRGAAPSGRPDVPRSVRCTTCDAVIGTWVDGRLMIRIQSRALVVQPTGQAEVRCHHCKGNALLPLFTVATQGD